MDDKVLEILNTKCDVIKKKLEIARLNQELALILAEHPTLEVLDDDEYLRIASVRETLEKAVRREIHQIGLKPPSSIDLGQFIADWVDDNWLSKLSHANLASGGERFPRVILDAAIKDLYQQDQDVFEIREELYEIQRGFQADLAGVARALASAARRAVDAPWRLLKKVKRSGDAAPAPTAESSSGPAWRQRSVGTAKKAGELRAQKNQHFIQQFLSKISIVFTGMTAVFMVCMLLTGLGQLYNAAALGIGIPWLIPELHGGQAAAHDSAAGVEAASHGSGAAGWQQSPHAAMATSLTALEIILVAPLPYLLVLGLTRYIRALAYQEQAAEFRKELLEFKAFEVALFIAIIAAAVVGRVLSDELELEFAAAVALVIGVLATYYFLIEKASKEASEEEMQLHKHRHAQEQRAAARNAPVTH